MKSKKKRPYINQNAGNVEANVAAFNHAATGGNMMGEELEEFTISDLINFIDYNGAEYRGAKIPDADPFMINQINIPDNMRLKWYDVDIIDDNTLQLSYVTQDSFDSEDSEKFIAEVKRFFEAILEREDYDRPLNVTLDVECRDGAEYGKLVYDLRFNEMNNMKLENLTEDAKVNLDNVTDVQEKSTEVIDPGFADGVREIKDNVDKVAELQRVRKAPEQGKEALSDDITITLDESLFESILNETGEWEDKEEINYSIDDYLTDIKYYGDGYITVEKIDFDIDQGDYKFTTAEVLNKAIKDGWSFKNDENEGLCLISNHNKIWKDVKDAVKNESFEADFDFKADMTLRDAYEKYEPEEFQLDKIRNDITLAELWRAIQDGKDVYEIASIDGQGFDSDVREGLFDMISQAFGIDYDVVYNAWLKN